FAALAQALCAQSRPSNQWPPLVEAAERGNVKIVESLIAQHPEWVAKGAEEGTRALLTAAGSGNKEMVTLLLARGVDVNGRSKLGNLSPLALAVRSGNVEMIEQLLAAGADPKAK